MKYKVIQVDDQEFRERLLVGLWSRANLHAGRDPRGKFEWFYTGSPFGPAQAFFLSDADRPGEEHVVGCCGLGRRRFWIDGSEVDAGLFADFAVDEEHRTLLPALTLQRALCTEARARFPLTYGFPNAAAVGIFQRIGFPLLGTIGRFVRVLRHEPFVRRTVRSPIVSYPVGMVLDQAMSIKDIAATIAVPRRGVFAWVDGPDSRFDTLFAMTHRRYRFIGDRTSAFLKWRFVDRPGARTEFVTLVDPTGNLRAYVVVLRKHSGDLILADFLAASDQDLASLLTHVASRLHARGEVAVTAFFLGSPDVARTLESRGFAPRESSKHVVVGAGASLAAAPETLANTREWYLTEADRDN